MTKDISEKSEKQAEWWLTADDYLYRISQVASHFTGERTMTPTELAKAFCEELSRNLTPEQLDEVNRLNAEDSDNICHSHDFCDANQVMLDAMGAEFENTDEQNTLINQAWAIAKAAEFSAYEVDRQERGTESRG
jgi:hypothetical protein